MWSNLLVVRISIGNGGWVALDNLGLPGPLYVRLGRIDKSERLRITELYLDASANRESSILDSDLGDLPLSPIEMVINTELADDVLTRTDFPAPDLSTLASYYATSFGNYKRQIEERNWVVISFASQTADPREKAGLLKIDRAPRKNRKVLVREVDSEYRLKAGPNEGLTDGFLHQVARAYAAAMVRGERPNVSISEQTGHPLRTVQRWVYMARKRGIMSPGRRGRAG